MEEVRDGFGGGRVTSCEGTIYQSPYVLFWALLLFTWFYLRFTWSLLLFTYFYLKSTYTVLGFTWDSVWSMWSPTRGPSTAHIRQASTLPNQPLAQGRFDCIIFGQGVVSHLHLSRIGNGPMWNITRGGDDTWLGCSWWSFVWPIYRTSSEPSQLKVWGTNRTKSFLLKPSQSLI